MDAYIKSKTDKAEKDRRATPPAIFDCISKALRLNFTLDVCADDKNFKVSRYYTEADDALQKRWKGICWMNPPYSKPGPRCEKAAREAAAGAIVVGLVPDDRSTEWFQKWIYPHVSAIYTTTRRIAFLNGDTPQAGNPKGSIIPIWTPWKVDAPAQGYIKIPKWNGAKGIWI